MNDWSAINPKQREFFDSYRGFIIDKFIYCQTPKENIYREIDEMLTRREEIKFWKDKNDERNLKEQNERRFKS